jgi:hypothetical protein
MSINSSYSNENHSLFNFNSEDIIIETQEFVDGSNINKIDSSAQIALKELHWNIYNFCPSHQLKLSFSNLNIPYIINKILDTKNIQRLSLVYFINLYNFYRKML